ncbi:gibberellin 2-beta-dioxygenase 6-like [Lotus japonicus]|uniref:gibberellin 2-beta-dioxygenase 6-like n=1 Tax=Lotus japonicus TaxID=34305 RepID=UPI0025839170|nr:gibberellin 2-beta-dioxygenase 6-like [Lotus japonicus]
MESYPPVFRCQQTTTLHPDDTSHDPIHYPDLVPVIDLQSLNHEDDANNIINKKILEEACEDWGLFRLVNHGVPPTLLKQLQELARELFTLPFESKKAAYSGAAPVTYFWGTALVTQSGTAVTRDPQNINWVEGFSVPLNHLSSFHPQLPTLESIKLLLMDYETHLSRIATTLFEAMAKNLDLNLETSKSYLSVDTGMVRVYRYPHGSVGWGMEVHTDSSILSILNQDDQVSGLEVLKDDRWLIVKPISNTLIVNLGDMMQAISNDRYKSVSHRVKVSKNNDRISICYFVFPGEDVVIESSKYKPFTYNEFSAQVQQDKKALGYKVGLARFSQKQDC